jgi:amino acid transporter
MTRLQNRRNYICIILFSILELFAIVGAYAFHHFTKTRMGMLRHVIYLNSKWEKMLPITKIRWIAIIIIIALMIISYLRYRNIRISSKAYTVTTILTIAVNGWVLYFLLFYSTETNRAYYILSVCFILVTVFQNIVYHCISSIKSRN